MYIFIYKDLNYFINIMTHVNVVELNIIIHFKFLFFNMFM